MDKIYTVYEAAELMNKSHISVRTLVRRYGYGRKVGRDWILTDDDIEKLKAIPGPGRPRGAKDNRPRKTH